ncbi:Six-hairpin glycosidase-like protein [Dissophora ornata]|nr:Six-hairpin glycosidase-like protein [Dissophora ornata]
MKLITILAAATLLKATLASPLVARTTCTNIEGIYRNDCGVVGTSQSSCSSNGCCWNPSTDGSPWCYYPDPISFSRPTPPDQNATTSWASSQYAYSLSAMMNNLSPAGSKTGCIVAAQSQTNGAGAWLLAINAVAELHYVAAAEFQTAGQASVTDINQPIFAYYGVNATSGSVLTGSQLSTLVANIFGEGDSYLDTLHYHMGSEQDMTEQFNPVTGYRQGAKHLTWSYASFITAIEARNTFLAL